MKFKLRNNSSTSVNSVDKELRISIPMENTFDKLLIDSNNSSLNLNELFIKEREGCDNYRIMLTIHPFCSNVLFNPYTEIMKNEGSDDVIVVTEKNDQYTFNNSSEKKLVFGKTDNLSLYDMIRNTEYSREGLDFEYHPGLNIFNNHILRNKSYRIVNRIDEKASDKDVFNTIEDYFRLDDGSTLQKCCRLDINDASTLKKHLYNVDDILSFENGDAINENLKEQNGWFGFYNTSTIDAKDKNGDSLDINRVINNKGNCEFIDMYPDRTLFSFAPKYNFHRGRCEYNWDVILTYPAKHVTHYEDETPITVIQDGKLNALYIVDAKYVRTASGNKSVMLRTLTKHNLKIGDFVKISFNENESNSPWTTIPKKFRVYSIGDTNGDDRDYYFHVNDVELLENIFCTPKEDETYTQWDYIRDYFYNELDLDNIEYFNNTKTYYVNELVKYNNEIFICYRNYINDVDNFYNYFAYFEDYVINYGEAGLRDFPTSNNPYVKVKEGENNKYYVLFNHDTQTSYIEVVSKGVDVDTFIMGIVNNAFRDNDEDLEVHEEHEITPWSDYINFRFQKCDGEAVCEYYVRKFKPISSKQYNHELYKLAFANTIYGDEVSQLTFTDDIKISDLRDNRNRPLTEIYATVIKSNRGYENWYINNSKGDSSVEYSHCFGPITCGFDFYSKNKDNESIRIKRETSKDVRFLCNKLFTIGEHEINGIENKSITVNDSEFYGDVVEFNPMKCEETVLADVNFRFNTVLRELQDSSDYTFVYDEMYKDDYDGGFEMKKIENTKIDNCYKPEGYYYKPHYKIQLKGFSSIQQATHRSIFVVKATPYQNNGMYIKLKTQTQHNLAVGDNLLLINEVNNCIHKTQVAQVIDKYTVVINIISRNDENYHDWVYTCNGINEKLIKVKAINVNIPIYATQVNTMTYIWRDVVNLWDMDNTSGSNKEMVYANNALYVDDNINFYLKRQNYDNSINNLIPKNELIKDFEGLKTLEKPIYEYKDETMNQC